jgi:DAK2 domain fusion protein YloV
VNLERAREIARAALANLEANRQRIDDLNVYPVPDGDTGTNLTLTVRAIVESLEKSSATGHEAVARELSRAALMGARGNSGVIFSQIVRGFADVLGERDPIDEPMIARAFRSASDAAYRAVRRPVEGTMLTVIREMAEAAESPEARDLERLDLLALIIARGEESLARTPELLAVLKEAGVVDAGGAGLLEIIRGLRAAVAGERPPEVPVGLAAISVEAMHHELSEFRYCTVFVIEGNALDAETVERELEVLGDSLLVVGDVTALKIHVHTDDPGAVLSIGTARGTIEGVEIADMHRQTVERKERLTEGSLAGLPTLETGVVVVAPGEGNRRLFESMGATRVIEGGQTMNPSTEEIVAAVDATPATEVIVLPNNKNVILSAEQAIGLVDKPMRVVPTLSVQAGLAAMFAYDAERAADENETDMLRAEAGVATGEVTVASRDVNLDGVAVRKGAWLGLVDGAAVASDESFDVVASAVVERLLGDGRAMLTLLTGADEPELGSLIEDLEQRHPSLEIEVHAGGQPHYPLLLSAE